MNPVDQINQLINPSMEVDLATLIPPVPKSSVEAETDATLDMLDPELATATDGERESVHINLGNFQRETALNVNLASDAPSSDVLASLRSEYGLKDPDATAVGAVQAIAAPEEQDLVDEITPAQVRATRQKEIREMAAIYRPVGITAGEAPLAAAETAGRFLAPTFDVTGAAVVLAQEFPEFATVLHANIYEGLMLVQSALENPSMSRDQASTHMFNISQGLQKQSEFGYYSALQEADLREMIFGPIADRGKSPIAEAVIGQLTTLVQVAEKGPFNLPVVAGALKAAKQIPLALSRLSGSSAAGLAARTAEGFGRLVELVRGRASNAALPQVQGATKIEDVIGSIALPKLDGTQVGSEAYVQALLLPAARREELAKDPAYVFGAVPTARINGNVVSDIQDGGITQTIQIGTKNGQPYKNQGGAQAALKRDFGGAGKVVPNANGKGFFIERTGTRQFGLEDVTVNPDLTTRGYNVWNWLGKATAGSEYANLSSNVATRTTERVTSGVNKMMDPFWRLPAGSQTRVADVLDLGDQHRVVHSISNLRQMGLNDAEILGYASARRAADLHLEMQNIAMRNKWEARGYRGLQVNGAEHGVKEVTVDEAVFSMSGRARDTIMAVDPAGGSRAISTVAGNERLLRLMSPTKNGERFMIVDAKDLRRLTSLPDMIRPFDGYLPRQYRYPSYVKEYVDGRPIRTLRGARSALEAEELAAEARAVNPGKDIRTVGSIELRQIDELDEIEALDDAGLLWTNTRGPSRLTDASGNVRLPTVEDRLRDMQADIGMLAGIRRWGDVQQKAWNTRYRDMFEKPWIPGSPTQRLEVRAGITDEAKVAQAKHEAEFIANILGVGKQNVDGVVQAVGTTVGRWFYNAATRVDRLSQKVRKDKRGSQLGEDLRNLADNITGQSGRVLANAKTIPYLLYLAGNPLRQLPLQMTLIPSYFGVKGAGKYMLGGFQKDFSTLFVNGVVETKSAQGELVQQFRRSGLMESLEHHTMVATIGTSGTTSKASRWGSAVDNTVQTMTAVGIGAGIKAEKVSAWLISRNRWLTNNPGKKIDQTAEKEIAAFAEELSLNPNRTDNLPFNKGILSVATQFMSMQVKQLGRSLQALPGVPTGQLTKAEARRMAGINLLTWGVGGYGLTQLADNILADPEIAEHVPEDARELLAEGLADYMTEAVLTYTTGEDTQVAFTESFSPVNIVGGSVDFARKLAEGVFLQDPAALAESRYQAPFLGVSVQVAEVIKFAAAINGAPELPEGVQDAVKLKTVAKRVAQMSPAMSNWMKYQAAMRWKAKFNGRGDPTVRANVGQAIMALVGVRTEEEVKMWEMQRLSQSLRPVESDIKSVRDEAYETSKWLLPMLDTWVDGKITYQEALTYINDNNAFFLTALDEELHSEYQSELRRIIDRRWGTRYDAMVTRLLQEVGTPKMPGSDNLEAIVQKIPDPETRQKVLDKARFKLFGGNTDG